MAFEHLLVPLLQRPLSVAASGIALPCQVLRDQVSLAVASVCFPAAPPAVTCFEATVHRAHPSDARQTGILVCWIDLDRLILNVGSAGSYKPVKPFPAHAPLYDPTLLVVQSAHWACVSGFEDGRPGKGAERGSLMHRVGGEMLPAAQNQGAGAQAQGSETLFC